MKKLFITILFTLLTANANAAVYTIYASNDTLLDSDNATTNYNNSTSVFLGANNNDAFIFKFDLSSLAGIPTDQIVEVELRVYDLLRGGSHNFTIYRVVRDWTSSQATWNKSDSSTNWGTAGAMDSSTDYTTSNAVTVANVNDGWVIIDARQLLIDILNNNNYGFIMRGSTGSSYDFLYTTEETQPTELRPRLTVRTATPGVSSTWYVRTGGGTCGIGNQCTGSTNADYDGSGSNEDCACSTLAGVVGVAAGEDTIILANGSYLANGVSFPEGTSTSLTTKIKGENWEHCNNPLGVDIYGTDGYRVVTAGSYTELSCLSITDHNSCIQVGPVDAPQCSSNFSATGLTLSDGSTGVTLNDVSIYGLARGIGGSQLGNVTATNLKLVGNSFVGWDSDFNADDSYTGTITLNQPTIDFNGCGMYYPLVDSTNLSNPDNIHHCWSQGQGGFGDAIGLGDGRTGDWVITGPGSISYNVSDGIDLLHGSGTGTLTIKKMRAEGNAGNQIKLTGTAIVEDSYIGGNCGYHHHRKFTTTPDQNLSTVGYQPTLIQGYATLTGTGISKTNENIATGNGSTTTYTGTASSFPIKFSSATISYTQGGVPHTATSGSVAYGDPRGHFTGTGINTSSSTINYLTGAYSLTFTSAPDNATAIQFDSYTYVDAVPTGTYTGDRTSWSNTTWDVVVDGNGTPDTFKWRKNLGGVSGSYTTGVAMTGSAQLLGEGISVQFKQTTGHTINDVYHFTTLGAGFDTCRATGNPISLAGGTTQKFINNTIESNGDIFIGLYGCSGGNPKIISRNNIYLGGSEFNTSVGGAQDKSDLFYTEASGCSNSNFDDDYSVICDTKNYTSDCSGTHSLCYASCDSVKMSNKPKLGGSTGANYLDYFIGQNFPVEIRTDSPAVGFANKDVGADPNDFYNFNRGSNWDAGAAESVFDKATIQGSGTFYGGTISQ